MHWLAKTTEVPEGNVTPANKGCPHDFGFATVVMTPADHSSGCPGEGDHDVIYGGDPAGFVINAGGVQLYHGGDTAAFTDMTIISELYEPTYALLPIGGRFTMGPKEAAYALKKFLKSVKVCIPMHFDTFPLLHGKTAPDQLDKELAGFEHELKTVNPYTLTEETELSFH
jgi:L-ascorbate metabolism protein UlaG (beta-lactamase superfamily)